VEAFESQNSNLMSMSYSSEVCCLPRRNLHQKMPVLPLLRLQSIQIDVIL